MAHQHPRPGHEWRAVGRGAVAQLGERRLCKAEVGGSSPPGSTISYLAATGQRHTHHSGKRSRGEEPPAASWAGAKRPRAGTFTTEERNERKTSYEKHSWSTTASGNPPAGADLEGYARARWQFRSRECLTKGQATKGARRMPRRHGPMKDVARLRKAPASCLASSTGDLRMGQPGPLHRGSRPAEHIGRIEGTGGTETSQYPEEKKRFP